ncbi:hypothetical protein Pint_13675 [Pistacia integerrima]|uniref:Uncharacterized protein n=1 Tax=Pistacia integerrima TaxID=434235 RepID=A0ACC0Y5X9_9ROSI|nr:hypothetical protein Pint_13675 [Pistacia integerrima]
MATLRTPAHSSTTPFGFSISSLPRSLSQNYAAAKTNRPPVRCALKSPPEWRESRRFVSFSLALSQLLFLPNEKRRNHILAMNLTIGVLVADAIAGSLFDKYVKKKKLDPLEVYVPPVILTQLQIKDLEKTLEVDKPEYASCRSQLRSGPAGSLRVNIRAVS